MPARERRKQSERGNRRMTCCRGLLPHIADFLEGEAGQTVCRRIRKHLEGCKTCRMHVDVQIGMIGLYKTWRCGTIPDGVKVRLRQRLAQVMSDGSRR